MRSRRARGVAMHRPMQEARYLLLGVLVCVSVIAVACWSFTSTATVAADQAAPLPTADAAPDALVDDASHESGVDHRGGFVATTSAANLMIHGVCGEFAGLDAAETYTATATAFVTLTSAGRLTTYTKQ